MGVRKIFIVLITIVACVIIGALVLNVLLPNTATSVVDAVEDAIFSATGMTFDLNGNGNAGTSAVRNGDYSQGMKVDDTESSTTGAEAVDGF